MQVPINQRFLYAAPLLAAILCSTAVGAGHQGKLVGWGRSSNGLLDLPIGDDFVAVSAGWEHSLALRSDGSLAAWGDNSAAQSIAPAGNDYKAIASGTWHNVALKTDGSLAAWGYGADGQTA